MKVDESDVKAVLSYLEEIDREKGGIPASIQAVAECWWYKVYPLDGPKRPRGRKY